MGSFVDNEVLVGRIEKVDFPPRLQRGPQKKRRIIRARSQRWDFQHVRHWKLITISTRPSNNLLVNCKSGWQPGKAIYQSMDRWILLYECKRSPRLGRRLIEIESCSFRPARSSQSLEYISHFDSLTSNKIEFPMKFMLFPLNVLHHFTHVTRVERVSFHEE